MDLMLTHYKNRCSNKTKNQIETYDIQNDDAKIVSLNFFPLISFINFISKEKKSIGCDYEFAYFGVCFIRN